MAKQSSIAIDIEADARKAEQLKREGERRRSLAKSKKITEETRQASYITRPTARKEAVLEALGDETLTARQVMQRLGYTDPNMVRPRLTELMDAGEVEVCGKALDLGTGRTVAMYRRVTDEV
jgi:hypothetical protein